VLPLLASDSPGDRTSWLDRLRADSALQRKAMGCGVLVFAAGLILALLGGLPAVVLVMTLLVVALLLAALQAKLASRMGEGAGRVAQSFLQPSGDSTPYEQTFSYQEVDDHARGGR
ncbi:MAG: hypothetical protein M3Z05_18635, partial [Gemmatimonadota bacterium]|nr:hypothetical protein [Gemmatimonadota bacterium]